MTKNRMPRWSSWCFAFLSPCLLSGCFVDAGIAAATVATSQAQAAKAALDAKEKAIKSINDSMADESRRASEMSRDSMEQAASPVPKPAADTSAAMKTAEEQSK